MPEVICGGGLPQGSPALIKRRVYRMPLDKPDEPINPDLYGSEQGRSVTVSKETSFPRSKKKTSRKKKVSLILREDLYHDDIPDPDDTLPE